MARLRPTRRNLATAGFAIAALAVVLLPWYRLDEHVPNGWDATWWARLVLVAALAGLALSRLDLFPRARVALAALALAAIAFRLAVVPDFGFAFDGLEVPTERRVGPFIALAGTLLALLADLAAALGSRRPGTEAAASAGGPAGQARA